MALVASKCIGLVDSGSVKKMLTRVRVASVDDLVF
jgi:hypothetical protein